MFLRLFDGALYVGQKSRAFYEHYRYPAHRLFFSPHCIDNDWFAVRATPEARARIRGSRGIGPETFVVLFAGKLLPFKRPLDVIAAAKICRAQSRAVEVMVAGSGELDAEMHLRADLSGVPLHMLGFCNQTEMPPAYAAADVLVLPSDGRETWGLVTNEALACGRPVILSDACGCAPDLAADGTTGRIVPLGDIKALADAIASVIEQPPRAWDIRARVDRYSVARAADGIIEAAETVRLVARGKRGRSAR
jgi:glycosyltransferase involved in cell wall biosynthesis